MSDETHAHEIVIIKRHGDHEEAHHGGVWKIAFADFMTAMMAFFLVMWLVSASDKTKAVIARYFNPVELIDSTPQPPGLDDAKKGGPSPQNDTKKPASADAKSSKPDAKKETVGANSADRAVPDASAAATHDEADLTRDPYAVLTEVAKQGNREAPEKTDEKRIEDAQRGVGSQGLKGGEAFRDPFDPLQGEGTGIPGEAAAAAPTPAQPPTQPPTLAERAAKAVEAAEQAAPPPAQSKPDEPPVPAAALRAKIAALGKAADAAGGIGPKLEVRQTSEGLLISLTDSADFAMFPSASARPAPKTLAMVEKIAQLLKTQKGAITVRGFTDSRPFRSDTYDNWRLSAARAQMAHYMLVRGGVADNRIDHIEGYADRRPKNPKNTEAAENRRIEILLRDSTP